MGDYHQLWRTRHTSLGLCTADIGVWRLHIFQGLDDLAELMQLPLLPHPYPSALKGKALSKVSSPRLREVFTDHIFGLSPIPLGAVDLRREIAARFQEIPVYIYSVPELVLDAEHFIVVHNKAIVTIGKLILKNGGRLESRGACLFDIGELRCDSVVPHVFLIKGPDGAHGTAGIPGEAGANGIDGACASCDCCGGRIGCQPSPGYDGEAGRDGKEGGNGLNGIRAFPAVIKIQNLLTDIRVANIGGTGGHGGAGGGGGAGGMGGKGGAGITCGQHTVHAACDGEAGPGGHGGRGGKSGDGGNGGRVVMHINGGKGIVDPVILRAEPGEPGGGGEGGQGLLPGRKGLRGGAGKEGNRGSIHIIYHHKEIPVEQKEGDSCSGK